MKEHGMDYLMSQVGTQAPGVFVLLVATVLAFVYFGRATIASVLTLSAVAVMLASKVAVSIMQADLVASKDASDLAAEELARQMAVVGYVGTIAHAAGLALLVAAVFVRRRRIEVA